MVVLHVKRGNESQFLLNTTLLIELSALTMEIVCIFNGRLKIRRICSEMEELVKHGPMFPLELLGLTEEQVVELKLVDPWEEKVTPSGGWTFNKDQIGRRNGRQPNPKMQAILKNAIADAQLVVSKKMVENNQFLTLKQVQSTLNILRGAVTIVYPMGLPPHDRIAMEFANTEDLSGMQAASEVIDPIKAELWFAGKKMFNDKQLRDYMGTNEKCKIIVKLVKSNEGAPGREPIFTEDAKKQIMLQQYRRQQVLEALDKDDDDQYLNSNWANHSNLKKQMHGMQNIKFRYGF